MGKGPTREQSVHDATNAYVRELTGGGVFYLPRYLSLSLSSVCVCVCVCVYLYLYIYI